MSDPTPANTAKVPLIIDLGRRKRGAVRKLRRGQGPLMDKARRALGNMGEVGLASDDSDAVFIVIERKRRRDDW